VGERVLQLLSQGEGEAGLARAPRTGKGQEGRVLLHKEVASRPYLLLPADHGGELAGEVVGS